MVYTYELIEELRKKVTVQAKSAEEAREVIEQLYNSQEIVLDERDFTGGVDINYISEKPAYMAEKGEVFNDIEVTRKDKAR